MVSVIEKLTVKEVLELKIYFNQKSIEVLSYS